MFCSKCGTQVNEGDKFCGNCGAVTAAAAPSAPRPAAPAAQAAMPRQAAPKQKGKMPIWMKALIGIGIFIVIIVVIALSATAGVVKPVEKHLGFLAKRDFRAAYDQTTAQDFKNATSFDDYMRLVRRFPALSDNKTYSLSERAVDTNGLGTVKGTVTALDGRKANIVFTLAKEGGEWKILNFSVNPSNF